MSEVPNLGPDMRREVMRDGFITERRICYGKLAGDMRLLVDRWADEYNLSLIETVGMLASLQHQLMRDANLALDAEQEGEGA